MQDLFAEQLNALRTASLDRHLREISSSQGAEIEIDGEFRGDTPSTLEIASGEHAITVRKTGYKAWEKKLKLAGAITLNAELEAE